MSTEASKPKIEPLAAPAEARPDTRTEVDTLILDYLTCHAIERVLASTSGNDAESDETLDWLIQPVQGFQNSHFADIPNSFLSEDLKVKTEVLAVANSLRQCANPQTVDGQPSLASLGLAFMNLCFTAVAKVSKTRWFDIGAMCISLATAEYLSEDGESPPEALIDLYSWQPRNPDPEVSSRWAKDRWKYAEKPLSPSATPEIPSPAFPVDKSSFLMVMAEFLYDLMKTLDAPILLQLERGKLDGLTREETKILTERVIIDM